MTLIIVVWLLNQEVLVCLNVPKMTLSLAQHIMLDLGGTLTTSLLSFCYLFGGHSSAGAALHFESVPAFLLYLYLKSLSVTKVTVCLQAGKLRITMKCRNYAKSWERSFYRCLWVKASLHGDQVGTLSITGVTQHQDVQQFTSVQGFC